MGSKVDMIYFCLDIATNQVKIGTSTNPRGRVKQLRTARGDMITLRHVTYGGKKDEKHLHEVFKYYHVGLEWFRYEGVLKQFIEARINPATEVDLVGEDFFWGEYAAGFKAGKECMDYYKMGGWAYKAWDYWDKGSSGMNAGFALGVYDSGHNAQRSDIDNEIEKYAHRMVREMRNTKAQRLQIAFEKTKSKSVGAELFKQFGCKICKHTFESSYMDDNVIGKCSEHGTVFGTFDGFDDGNQFCDGVKFDYIVSGESTCDEWEASDKWKSLLSEAQAIIGGDKK